MVSAVQGTCICAKRGMHAVGGKRDCKGDIIPSNHRIKIKENSEGIPGPLSEGDSVARLLGENLIPKSLAPDNDGGKGKIVAIFILKTSDGGANALGHLLRSVFIKSGV